MNPLRPGGSRRRPTRRLARCAACGLHLRLCLCADVVPLAVATRVLVLSSAREARQATNSGRLVPLTLRTGELRVHAPEAGPLRLEELARPGRRTLLLFPGAGACLEPPTSADPRPLTLLVLDGTWRAARRMASREPALAALERVRLPDGPPSSYRLRSHPDPRCLATFEAVARALGLLEGAAVQQRLEGVFQRFVERTLFSRGRLSAARVSGGIPPPVAGPERRRNEPR